MPFSSLSQRVSDPGRYQQTEIPKPETELTEWRTQKMKCGACGGVTTPTPPPEALESFGPRLQAEIAAVGADKRQTTRQTQQLLFDLHGVEISTGQINAIMNKVGALCVPAAEALHAEILRGDAAWADETSWRLTSPFGFWKHAFVWSLSNKNTVYFEIQPTRSGLVAENLIPISYEGITHTDCYAGYNHINAWLRQICWAHLKRHFQKRAEASDGPEREFGELGLAISKRVFKLSKETKTSTERQRKQVIADMDALVEYGLTSEAPQKTRAMATTLAKHRVSLWHCLYREDVDATNNHAEQMVRPVVMKRKLSIGSGSPAGAKALAALLSVSATARLRGVSPFAFIEQTVRAAKANQLSPQMA